MNKATLSILLVALLGVGADAQPMQPSAPGGPPRVPTSEELATVPKLTAIEQIELRKILLRRRDAHEAAHEKARSESDTLRTNERSVHERIDEQSSEQIRKLLGDEGYRQFAEWELAHRAGAGPRSHPPMPEQDGGPGTRMPPRRDGDAGHGAPPEPSRE